MKCNNCGNNIPEGTAICPMCGSPVESVKENNEVSNVALVAEKEATSVAPAMEQAPVSSGSTPTPETKKKDNKVFIIICAILVVIIIVLLFLVLNNDDKKSSDDKPNNEKTTEKTTDKTTNSTTTSTTNAKIDQTTGQYVDYSGIELYVPDTFTAQESGGAVVYQSQSKRQFLAIQLTGIDYSAMNLDEFANGLTSEGYVATSKDSGNHKGVQYGVVRGTNAGTTMSTGYAQFTSGVISIFAFRTDLALETDYLDTLVDITTKSKFPASFSKNDSKKIDYKAFISNTSNLKTE